MRTVAQYLAEAAEQDQLANTAPLPELKKRHADMAAAYRLLARERERLVQAGLLASDAGEPGG